jgi:hypothetical protein
MRNSQKRRAANKATNKTEKEMIDEEATTQPSSESTALVVPSAQSVQVKVYGLASPDKIHSVSTTHLVWSTTSPSACSKEY